MEDNILPAPCRLAAAASVPDAISERHSESRMQPLLKIFYSPHLLQHT